VYNKPANTFVAGFMGSPRMNILKAKLLEQDGHLMLQMQNADQTSGIQIQLPHGCVPSALAAYAGKDVLAGIRAEAVSLSNEQTVTGPLQRFFDAKVEVIEPTGADTLVVLRLGEQEITVRLDPDVALKPGQQARFLVDLAKLVCFDARTETLIA
jgi:multiple sugar transport system ATP-binding protein